MLIPSRNVIDLDAVRYQMKALFLRTKYQYRFYLRIGKLFNRERKQVSTIVSKISIGSPFAVTWNLITAFLYDM